MIKSLVAGVGLLAWVVLWKGSFGIIEKGTSLLGLVTLSFVVGAVLLALSGSAIALAGSLRLVLATGFVYGFGYGAFTLSGNVMSSELAP